MSDGLSFINTMQKTSKIFQKKIVSVPSMDERKLHTPEFQLKGIGRKQNLADALYQKYIKLVIQKILFILVLCSFHFYFKITWLPQQNYPFPNNITPLSKIKISDPPPAKTCKIFTPPPKLEGGCMPWIITMVCTKKNLFRTNGLFWAHKWHILKTADQL